MRVFLFTAGLAQGHTYGTYTRKQYAQDALLDKNSALEFVTKAKADVIVTPDGVERREDSDTVPFTRFLHSLKPSRTKLSRARRASSKGARKSTHGKSKKTTSAKGTIKKRTVKKVTNRKPSKAKPQSWDDTWNPKRGGVWRVYVYADPKRDEYKWGCLWSACRRGFECTRCRRYSHPRLVGT